MRRHLRLRRWAKWGGAFASLGVLLLWAIALPLSVSYSVPDGGYPDWSRFQVQAASGMFSITYGFLGRSGLRIARNGDFAVKFIHHRFAWLPSTSVGKIGLAQFRQLSVPFWLLFALASIPTGFLFWRDNRHIPPGHCRCGYDLSGNTSGVCPECGATVPVNSVASAISCSNPQEKTEGTERT